MNQQTKIIAIPLFLMVFGFFGILFAEAQAFSMRNSPLPVGKYDNMVGYISAGLLLIGMVWFAIIHFGDR